MKRLFACLTMASTLLASVGHAAQPPPSSPAIRLPTWEEAGWISLSIIASSATAGAGTVAAATIQTIGLLGIAASDSVTREPEIQPPYFAAPGPQAPGPEVLEAMLSLNPGHVPAVGSPAEVEFIHRVNDFVDRGLALHTATNPDAIKAILNEMSVALEIAANAYDATTLNYTISQADIDAFKAECADGTCPALEDSMLTAAGLTSEQREVLSLYFSTVDLNLAQPSVSASAILHQGAQHLRQLPLWKGLLMNAGNFFSPCTTPFAVCCSGDWETGTASALEIAQGFGNAGAYVDTEARLHLIFHQTSALPNGTIPIPGDFSIGAELSQALGYASIVITGGTYVVDFSDYTEFGEVAFETAQVVGAPLGTNANSTMQLGNSYPNPTRALTSFSFTTTKSGPYQVSVVDVTGRLIRKLYDQQLEPGEHHAEWEGTDGAGNKVRGGVYFYVLRGEGRVIAKKVTIH